MGLYSLIEKKKREQKRKEKKKIAKVATFTAIAGAALGSAAGVLFAPKSGKETRTDLVNKSVEAKDKIVEKSAIAKENLSAKYTEGKNNINSAKEKISTYLANKKKGSSTEEVTETEVTETISEEQDQNL
ncbi:MAG: YtxH domain-containing protein [Clostridiaceae bacterium]|nr:YtxH domain-containing protein [Clostridiaceae bacterium]